VASVFSAALELTRERALELRQDAPYRDLYLRRIRAAGARTEETG
jgi:chromatin segregation and condensation protein Rec8/ScpA/Scc1 (kleisin family)